MADTETEKIFEGVVRRKLKKIKLGYVQQIAREKRKNKVLNC